MQIFLKKTILTIFILLLTSLLCFNIPANQPTITDKDTNFFTVQQIDNVWWLIDPNGEKFFASGISFINQGQFNYEPEQIWANRTQNQLINLGFNTLIGANTTLFPDIPYIYKLKLKQLNGEDGWTHRRIPDVFDPTWKQNVYAIINTTAALHRNNTNLIGYQTDNEMKWGPDVLDVDTLLEVYFEAPPTTAGKQQTITFFQQRYQNNTNTFNSAWNMNIQTFDDLQNHKKLGKIGWIQTHGPAKDDIDAFSRLVAHKYFNITSTALHQADPNHLNCGVRFFFQGVPAEVLDECGKHVDIISMNYYRKNIKFFDPQLQIWQHLFNCIPSKHWMYQYHALTNKPLLISEFSFDEKNDYLPLIANPSLDGRGLILSAKHAHTQHQRAQYYEWYTTNCLIRPYLVGHVWFSYRDKLNVVNYGLVNMWDELYTPLATKMHEINTQATTLHNTADGFNPPTHQIIQLTPTTRKKLQQQLNTTLTTTHQPTFHIKQNTKKINYNTQTSTLNQLINTIPFKNKLYVGGSGQGNYTSIQDALDNSTNNTHIYVYPGDYNETLTITKSIYLQGQNPTTTAINGPFIDDDFEHSTITITSDNVTITGFTISSTDGYYLDYFSRATSGIDIFNSSDCTITNNIFYNLGNWGIRARKITNLTFSNNTISIVLNKLGCGLMLDSCHNIQIINNTMSQITIACIWIARSTHITITHNIIASCLYSGILLERCQHTQITKNTIEKNQYAGIILKNSQDLQLTKNNFLNQNTYCSNLTGILYHPYYRYLLTYDIHNITYNQNYWGRPRILPKIHITKYTINSLHLPYIHIDWQPSQQPHNI